MKHKNLLKISLLFFTLLSINSFAQVVINEVVTDPQTDWSTNGFNGTDGGGTVSQGVDEYIELFIKKNGLDLTNWTLELIDGSNVIGDLTSSGAFSISNYISSGSGTFINTEVGDYLVLGNVAGSGAMNNSITINLKDAGGNVIDSVILGGSGQAPDGNASSTSDEAVIRTLNGNDTDISNADFSQSVSSLGMSNSSAKNWLGKIDNNWSNPSNWDDGAIPTTTTDVFITNGLENYPTSSSAISAKDVNIASGATIISTHTFTANSVTYNRSLANANQWYLMSCPVTGAVFDNLWANENSIASSSQNVNNRGVSWYDNSSFDNDLDGSGTGDSETGYWRYMDIFNFGDFTVGKGFGILKTNSGNLNFLGVSLQTTTKTFGILKGFEDDNGFTNNFNFVGNPFTAYLNLGDFFADNGASVITGASIYLWNGSTYITKQSGLDAAFEIAPGQGFFVEVANNTNLTFDITDINHLSDITPATTDTFQKTARPEITLNVNYENNNRYAKIFYIDGTTKGYDLGFDGKLFGGVSHSFSIYSELVESDGNKYQVQSLPNSDHENMVVPVGIIAAAGKEITFTAESSNLPFGLKVFLEDRENNIVTRLDEVNSNYKITLNNALNGSGRFYLHTRSSALSTDNIALEGTNIYQLDKNSLRINGINSNKASIKIYSILGKQVLDQSFSSKGNSDITLPNLNTGVYIVQVATEKGKIKKKIVLK